MAAIGWTSRLVTAILGMPPLFAWAKRQARQMMIDRAEGMGVPWRQIVADWRSQDLAPDLAAVENPAVVYPDYYTTSFHAYEEGNLGWEPAIEVEVAALAVHSRVFPEGGPEGDARLRASYHGALQARLPQRPQRILDGGCSVGMSTFALQDVFPEAQVTGLDLSPYFLAVAHRRSQQAAAPQRRAIAWVHGLAEATGLPAGGFDLVSFCLVFHELPQEAAAAVLREAYRLLVPGGHFALMDMNPQSPVYAQMPPYILTLLKSTEPYLDQYFALDLAAELTAAGFEHITFDANSPRHRTVVARKPSS
ncbi:MAG: class I SAM-dependent methyltransferase [Pseudanabaenaceae cyanobacterium]